MDRRSRHTFLALIALQVLHSVEEYWGRLFDVFMPARTISQLVSSNHALGFIIVNLGFIAFGFWCYFTRVRVGAPTAWAWAWAWVVLEFANGIGHPLIAISRGTYFPGVITAPFLLMVSAYLGYRLNACPSK